MQCQCQYCQKAQAYTSLEDFRRSTCVDPWTFWGWAHPTVRGKGKGVCQSIVRQAGYSSGCDSGTLGREDILKSLRLAEQTYRDYLGDVVPTWHTETVDVNKWGCSQGWRNSRKVVVPSRNIREVGKPRHEVLATVTRGSDAYRIESKIGSIPDTFIVGVSGLENVEKHQIQICVSIGERTKDESNLRRWQIPFDSIELSEGALTITGRAYLLARPELYEVYQPFDEKHSAYRDYSLDPTILDNYVQRIEIVKTWVDHCDNKAISRNHCGCPVCCPDKPTCEVCTNVQFCVEDAKAGILRPVNQSCYLPDKYCISYLSEGLSCDRDWTRDISILAIAYNCAQICSCSFGCLEMWYADMSNENSKKRTLVENLANPIGTRVGHMHAWNVIKQFRNKGSLAW